MITRLKALKHNNKGAGLVTVIIALSFLTILGLTIMTLAYTQSEMRSADRTGREVAYNANGVVDQLLSGAQLAISDSIEKCYADTMVNYSAKRDTIETEFDKNFILALENWAPYHNVTSTVGGVDTDTKYYYVPDGADDYTETTTKSATVLTLFGTKPAESVVLDRIKNGGDAVTGTYNVDALERFVKARFAGNIEVESTSGKAIWDFENKRVVLKDVQVNYTRLIRTVTITTDIVMDFPDLGYVYEEEVKSSNFTEFAVVAAGKLRDASPTTGRLVHKSGDVIVKGKAYADEINIDQVNADHQFKAENGSTVISKGDVTVRGSKAVSTSAQDVLNTIDDDAVKAANTLMYRSAFLVDNSSTLWANGVTLESNGIAALCYRANVLNDLKFAKPGTKAVLMGDYYYGFGNSLTDSARSSSIIFNLGNADGKIVHDDSRDTKFGITQSGQKYVASETTKSVLDTSQINNITLAGYAFIDNGISTGNVKTGESMATKRSLKAYLAPLDMLNYDDDPKKLKSNPEVFANADEFETYAGGVLTLTDPVNHWGSYTTEEGQIPAMPNNIRLWAKNGEYMYARDYGITIKAVSIPYAGRTLGYFFLEFHNTGDYTAEENANRYFRDFFDAHPEQIDDLVNAYLDITNPEAAKDVVSRESSSSNIHSVGNTLRKFTGKIDLSPIKSIIKLDEISQEVTNKLTYFRNLCMTLNTGKAPEDLADDTTVTDAEKATRLGPEWSSGKFNTNPFYYYVNIPKINAMFAKLGPSVNTVEFYGSVKVTNADGSETYATDNTHPVAIITRENNLVLDNTEKYSKVCLVISLNNVTVKRDYDGLIMANGNITIDAGAGNTVKLTSDSAYVTKAATANATAYSREDLALEDIEGLVYGMPYEFVYGEFSQGGQDDAFKTTDYWDVSKLAYYDNYKKN